MNIECEIRSIVASAVDIETLLTKYGLERQEELFDVEDFRDVYNEFSNKLTSSNFPTLDIVAGPPLSGKSHYVKDLKQQIPEAFVLQFDDIMIRLKGYRESFEKFGNEQAFNEYELPARWLGYQLLIKAVVDNSSIIWGHSSAIDSHVSLYKYINHQTDYSVRMTVVVTPMEIIKQRMNNTRDGGRFLPEHYISERSEKLNSLLPEYKNYITVIEVEGKS